MGPPQLETRRTMVQSRASIQRQLALPPPHGETVLPRSAAHYFPVKRSPKAQIHRSLARLPKPAARSLALSPTRERLPWARPRRQERRRSVRPTPRRWVLRRLQTAPTRLPPAPTVQPAILPLPRMDRPATPAASMRLRSVNPAARARTARRPSAPARRPPRPARSRSALVLQQPAAT